MKAHFKVVYWTQFVTEKQRTSKDEKPHFCFQVSDLLRGLKGPSCNMHHFQILKFDSWVFIFSFRLLQPSHAWKRIHCELSSKEYTEVSQNCFLLEKENILATFKQRIHQMSFQQANIPESRTTITEKASCFGLVKPGYRVARLQLGPSATLPASA